MGTSAPSISLPTVSPSQNPTSSPKPTITPPTVSPTIFISPSQQPTASCKDFEGIFFKLKYNEVFFNYTCSLIRDTTEGGCNGNLGEVMKQYPGSYIPDERISEDMSVSDICPYIYKDICETCATGVFVSEWHAFPGVYCADGYISN